MPKYPGGAYVLTVFVRMYAPLWPQRGTDMPKYGTSAPPGGLRIVPHPQGYQNKMEEWEKLRIMQK
jgi:hypothetical protein